MISGKEIVKNSTDGASGVPTVPASLLTKVQALPEVEAAGGSVSPDEVSSADILGKDGKPVARESVSGSYDPANAQFSPLKLKSGKLAEGPDQVVVDAGTVAKQHYEIGDEDHDLDARHEAHLRADRRRDVRRRRLARLREHRRLGPRDGAEAAAPRGRFDTISISAKDGTSSAELVRAVAPLVPAALQVKDSAKQADEDAEELDSSMSIIKYFLLGFGGDRAARRRVRDLQHPVDHRRPADA